jgi:DNA invertase Pin-like site-specific DNA recombinase
MAARIINLWIKPVNRETERNRRIVRPSEAQVFVGRTIAINSTQTVAEDLTADEPASVPRVFAFDSTGAGASGSTRSIRFRSSLHAFTCRRKGWKTIMKVALYARYSSDIQRDTSIPDQLRLCRVFVERQGWMVTQEYTDPKITGATLLLRPGIQRLMQDAMNHRIDALVAESLDRFSRDQEDTAALYKRLKFLGVSFVTIAEGEINELHVGFKGTMNALYLKDLAAKTRRGMRGRVEAGKSGGGVSYGYRAVRSVDAAKQGEREIDEREAEVVFRSFEAMRTGVRRSMSRSASIVRVFPGRRAGRGGRAPSTATGNEGRASSTTESTWGA